MAVEYVYLGRNNPFSRIVHLNGEPQELASVIRVTLHLGDRVVDTEVDFGAITYPTDVTGEIIFELGTLDGISTGTYHAKLFLFESDTPEGIYWDRFPVKVIDLDS